MGKTGTAHLGFRRSLNRPAYEVKFFNLPLFMFILDQAMLILYFRMAVTTAEGKEPLAPEALARVANDLVVWIFVLYVAWDLLGLWMAAARVPGGQRAHPKPRYPEVNPKDNKMTHAPKATDWIGFAISAVTLSLLTLFRFGSRLSPNELLPCIAALLLLYRWAKEIRTSCRC